jgi:hypothetical protein
MVAALFQGFQRKVLILHFGLLKAQNIRTFPFQPIEQDRQPGPYGVGVERCDFHIIKIS